MPILTKSGRTVIAESIAARPVHIAWGSGDGSWTAPPSENTNQTTLQGEIGRRKATEISFVAPSSTGDIVLTTGRYVRSATPTNHLYVRADFDFADASSSTIREIAAFVGTQTMAGLPAGQEYFVPGQVVDPGRMLHLENITPVFRSPAIRESFAVVITF
jgi:hypothetical protein